VPLAAEIDEATASLTWQLRDLAKLVDVAAGAASTIEPDQPQAVAVDTQEASVGGHQSA